MRRSISKSQWRPTQTYKVLTGPTWDPSLTASTSPILTPTRTYTGTTYRLSSAQPRSRRGNASARSQDTWIVSQPCCVTWSGFLPLSAPTFPDYAEPPSQSYVFEISITFVYPSLPHPQEIQCPPQEFYHFLGVCILMVIQELSI